MADTRFEIKLLLGFTGVCLLDAVGISHSLIKRLNDSMHVLKIVITRMKLSQKTQNKLYIRIDIIIEICLIKCVNVWHFILLV